MTITVSITDSDIDNGTRGDCWKCPVALALWRATGEKYIVWSGNAYPLGRRDRNVILPNSVQSWIGRFDRSEFPKPMEFQLTVPDGEVAVCV
jgi:hypothetical protein